MGVGVESVHRIASEAELRSIIGGSPSELVAAKVADRVNAVTRRFVEASPLVCVGTAGPSGLDVSPRGGAPGFVRMLDERTLFLPERPGNRLADSLINLLGDDRIALLFLIPGVGDTFRVNGTAVITDDAQLLAECAHEGRLPALGVLVTVLEAFTQCPKALIRSQLWDPARHVDRSTLPSGGEVLKSVRADGPGFDPAQYDRERAQRYARGDGLY